MATTGLQADAAVEAVEERANFDLRDPRTFAQGHPRSAYDWLLAHAPVYRHPGDAEHPPFWVLSRHADVQAVSRDYRRFSSREGFRVPERLGLASLRQDVRAAVGRNLLTLDRPEHGEVRTPLQPSFLPGALKGLEAKVEQLAETLFDRLDGRREIEFVSEVAAIVPIETLCLMLGIPERDVPRVFDWTNKLVGTSDPEFGLSPEESTRVFEEVFRYGAELIERRRKEPKDDLATILAGLPDVSPAVDEAMMNGMFTLLLAAGNETTRNSLTASILALTRFPEQKQRLIADPSLIPNAVAELLRYTTPVIQMMRTALEDLVIGGEQIAQGERVVLLYGAANSDPEIFASPHRLDVGREAARKQMSFGIGMHRCLGAGVATLQLEILLRGLLRRFPDIEASGEPDYLLSNFVCSIKRMPVRLFGGDGA